MGYKIVNTDNFGGDYPDEEFVTGLPYFHTKERAQRVADAINSTVPGDHHRYWKVVDEDYTLQPGFEP
ncbi:hypothetical protein ULT26_004284 [Salmonella enterica]|nr:hypothetical protein [Salmonella enterica]